jgi:hypothetical protein
LGLLKKKFPWAKKNGIGESALKKRNRSGIDSGTILPTLTLPWVAATHRRSEYSQWHSSHLGVVGGFE